MFNGRVPSRKSNNRPQRPLLCNSEIAAIPTSAHDFADPDSTSSPTFPR